MIGKPWSLKGRGADIVTYRDDKKLTWEEIAVLVKASSQAVKGAYAREKAKEANRG